MGYSAVARFAVAALVLCACGGKVLDERAGGVGSSSGAGTSPAASGDEGASSSGLVPTPTKPHSEDPCATICEGNGGCVGGQRECLRRCGDDLGSASCTLEARVYIGCYADHIENEGCSVLPPVCESAYCAYARCAGEVVPGYCH